MSKKSIVCIVLALVMCISLAACTSSAPATSSAAPAQTEAPKAEAPKAEAAAPAQAEAPKAEAAAPAQAEAPAAPKTDWPQKAVKVYCGYAAGGSDDIIARTFVDAVNRVMPNGQVMFVENLKGASGTIAATEVAKAEPDGYTLMCCGTGVLCGQPLTIGTEYDGTTVAVICQIANIAQAMVVRADAPYDDLEGWVKWCKEHPGEFTYATSGKNGPGHIGSSAVA